MYNQVTDEVFTKISWSLWIFYANGISGATKQKSVTEQAGYRRT